MPAAPVAECRNLLVAHGSKRCGQRGWNGQPGGANERRRCALDRDEAFSFLVDARP